MPANDLAAPIGIFSANPVPSVLVAEDQAVAAREFQRDDIGQSGGDRSLDLDCNRALGLRSPEPTPRIKDIKNEFPGLHDRLLQCETGLAAVVGGPAIRRGRTEGRCVAIGTRGKPRVEHPKPVRESISTIKSGTWPRQLGAAKPAGHGQPRRIRPPGQALLLEQFRLLRPLRADEQQHPVLVHPRFEHHAQEEQQAKEIAKARRLRAECVDLQHPVAASDGVQ